MSYNHWNKHSEIYGKYPHALYKETNTLHSFSILGIGKKEVLFGGFFRITVAFKKKKTTPETISTQSQQSSSLDSTVICTVYTYNH